MKESLRIRLTGLPIVRSSLRTAGATAVVGLMALVPLEVSAQGRGNSRGPQETVDVRPGSNNGADRARSSTVLSADMQSLIREYYSSRSSSQIASLPPGIRRNLARGKPLPPGIAKRFAPSNISQRVRVPLGYQLVEAGRDLLLVNVATNLIHDILLDVVR